MHPISMGSDAHVGSLKWAAEGIFTAWKSVNATNQCCFCFVTGAIACHQHTVGFTLSLIPSGVVMGHLLHCECAPWGEGVRNKEGGHGGEALP